MVKHITVIGAGISGLSFAWKLQKLEPESKITILEKDSVAGGLAKTIDWNGYPLDLGPHRIYTEIPEIKEFLTTFCNPGLEQVKRHSRMFLRGRYISYPIKPFETFLALGVQDSIRFFISALEILFRKNEEIPISYADYVKGYYGEGLYDQIFKPFAKKVWGLPGDQLSAETARVRLKGDSIWDALKDSFFSKEETYVSSFLYPKNGIGDIAKQFENEIVKNGVEIIYNADVTKFHIDQNKITEIEYQHNDQNQRINCDVLVSTIPLPDLLHRFEPAPPQSIFQAMEHLHFRSLVLLYVLYPKKISLNDTWLYYPEEHVPFSRISVPDNFRPTRSPQDHTCFCVEFTCEYNDKIWNSAAKELVKPVQKILLESGVVDCDWSDTLAVPIREGYPIYQVGYEPYFERSLEFIQKISNCLTVGRQGLFRHNNIDQSIQMGLLAAEQVAKSPYNLEDWYKRAPQFKDYRIID